jgi:putative AdoMet-dependent methyltransferase
MRSQYVDEFNHDDWAAGYDKDVQNETNPIRAGYGDLLGWVAKRINESAARTVVDLGSGTGNLISLISEPVAIIAVDTSSKMHEVARAKLLGRSIEYVKDDILAFVTEKLEPCNAITSTYALHHLTPEEKQICLKAMASKLNPGGQIVIGDLMFENEASMNEVVETFVERGQTHIVRDIQDEFFWDIERDCNVLTACGLTVSTEQFSDLSWVFVASID